MERLGRYQLVRKIATGGMAEVYLAKAEGPGGFAKTLVVKRILPELAENRDFVEMFLAEARLAAQLNHPNIVQIFDFGQAGDSYFIAMEYADGPNLRSLMKWAKKTEPLAPSIAAKIVALACEGLGYAHEFADPETGQPMNLIHRDVSTENIVVVRSGAVKVLDFGVARAGQKDKGNALTGKIAYIPPEQLYGKDIDLRVDVYALGVVLYQLLAMAKPYSQEEDVSLIGAILTRDPVPVAERRPDLPAEMARIVGRAMARELEDRYPSCRELQADLEKFISAAGGPMGSVQLAQLVARFHAAGNADVQDPQTSVSPSRSLSGLTGPSGPPARPSHPGRAPMARASTQAPPRAPEPSKAPPPGATTELELPALVPPGDAKAALAGPKTEREMPALPAEWGAPAPQAPAPRLPTPAPGAPPKAAAPAVPDALSHAEAAGNARVLAYRPARVAPPPICDAVQSTLVADRTRKILRKLPLVAARLLDATAEVPWPVYESLAGCLDAALMGDDHALVLKLAQRADAQPGTQGRFAGLLRGDLGGPLRLLWLVERLRAGLPADPASLKAWLSWLGPSFAPSLMWAIDALDPGSGQDLLCEALAPIVAADPSAIVARAAADSPRNLAAWCLVLEKAQARDRARVFQQILQRRDPQQQMDLLTARARAGGPESVSFLIGALNDKSDKVRRHVLKLLGEVGDERVVGTLGAQVLGPSMEARGPDERKALWTALAAGGEAALPLFERVLMQKGALLNKKKTLDAKLPAAEALAEMRHPGARQLLERTGGDPSQPEEVSQAAFAALSRFDAKAAGEPADEGRPSTERRPWLGRSLCLQLLYFARASTVVDLRSELLDGAFDRLHVDLRQTLQQEGKVRLLASDSAVTLNALTVRYGLPTEEISTEVAHLLALRDFRGLSLDAPIPARELRALLLWLFDPEGGRETVPAGRALTLSGRTPGPVTDPPLTADPVGRTRELYLQAIALLKRERDALVAGQAPVLADARALLEEWACLFAAGKARMLGVVMDPTLDSAAAVHAANTTIVALAFGADLGLKRAELYELGELGLFYALHQALQPRERANSADQPLPDDLRLRTAALFLNQLRHRRGASLAVAAIEAGLDHSQLPGMLASLVSLAEAWDTLLVGGKRSPGAALQALLALEKRFQPELLNFFAKWARIQFAIPRPTAG